MIRRIFLQRLAHGLGVFLCVLSITSILISCSSDDDGNKGWVTITEPSDSTSYTAENIDTIRISGKMFQSPSGGTKSGTECGCSNIAICWPFICWDYSYFVFALTVTVTNQSTGVSIGADLSEPDFWTAEVPLVYGENLIEVYVEDINGISAAKQILIEVQDTIQATILSQYPENNSINVATTTAISAIFSDLLDPDSISSLSFSLSANGRKIEGLTTFDDSTYELVFFPIDLLLYNTSYTVRVNSDLTDINGTSVVADSWQFTTIPIATTPTVQTEQAINVVEISATLSGSVSPNYGDTEAWFEWGTDSNLSAFSTTTKTDIPALSDSINLSRKISLSPGVLYYYRIAASNYAGTEKGNIQSFYTLSPPTVITFPSLVLSPYQVKLSGSVNPNGHVTETSFKLSFQPDTGYVTRSSPPVQIGDARQFVNVEHMFDQLASGSKYYYRLDATNPIGTATNGVFSLTTPYSTSSCWAKRYDTSIEIDYTSSTHWLNEITSIEQTQDDGYIFIHGLSFASGSGVANADLIKTNSDGGVEWSRGYKNSIGDSYSMGPHVPLTIKQINTGGYIVAGHIDLSLDSVYTYINAWVAELDPNGEPVWLKEYGIIPTDDSNEDWWYQPIDVQILPDGYVISGIYRLSSSWMMKIDKTGKLIWSHSYPGELNDVAQVSGGFVMLGTTGLSYAQERDMIVQMLNQEGAVQWANTYGTAEKDTAKVIAVSSDTIAIAGTVTYPDETTDVRVFGIDTNGTISWQYIFDSGHDDRASSINMASDGGFIIGANTDISDADKSAVLLKLSNSGILEWQKSYPGKTFSNDHDTLRPISGDDYIIGVRTIPSQDDSIELIKTDSSGSCSPLDSSSLMVSGLSDLTVTPSTVVTGSSSPTEELAITINAFDFYVAIEQVHP